MDGVDLDLCPPNNRRTSKQVWMQLFVVHLTTITALCHVLSLRGDRIISWKVVAYLLMPATLIISQVLVLAIIVGAVVCWILFDRTRKFRKTIIRAVKLSLASAPESQRFDEAEEIEPLLKTCGRVLLACSFLAQSCGTLALFIRRVRHNAVTWADIRIAEVAGTGIFISLYWILMAAKVPVLFRPLPVQPIHENDLDDLEVLILRIRGAMPVLAAGQNQAWREKPLRFATAYYLCTIVLIVKAVWLWQISPHTDTWPFASNLTWNWIFYWAPNGIHWGWFVLLGRIVFWDEDYADEPRRTPLKWTFARGVYIFMMLAVIKMPMFLRYVYSEWNHIAEQLTGLEGTPVNQSCPLLWSDPASNWVWAID